MTPADGGSGVNRAFEKALHYHLAKWESDPRSFPDSATPETLHSELKLLKEHGNNYQQTTVYRYTSRLSDLIDRFETFFIVVDTFVSSNPTIAALVWGGMRFIIRTVSEYSKDFKRIMDILEDIGRKLYFYHRYATAIYKNSDRVMEALANVYGDILTVFTTIKKTFIDSKNRMRHSIVIGLKALWLKGNFEEVIGNLDRRHAILNDELQLVDREVNYADREEHTIDQWQKKMDHLQCLLRFDGSDCREKHKQSQNKTVPESGAGGWLLGQDVYKRWRDSRGVESDRHFWLHGPPGSGKTVLTSIVIEDLKQYNPPMLAIFYCDYRFEIKTRTDSILRSLLAQLLHSFDGSFSQAPPVVHKILARFSTVRSVTDSEIPLDDVIVELTTHCEDVTIIIDALDECNDRGHILTLLRRLPSSVHLFVTSRNENDIRHSFRSHDELLEREVRPDDIEGDVRNYVANKLNVHLLAYPSFVHDRSLIHTIMETLVEKANGMFLWVFFQVANILECDTDDDIHRTLQNLPKGLEETFVRCLNQMEKHSSRARLRRILSLVVCLGSIAVNDLFDLLNVEEMDDYWRPERIINDVSTLISRCSHLVTESGDHVALIHFSVYDFLTSNPLSFDSNVRTLPEYHCYPLFDAYKATARTFGKSHRIVGGPKLWRAKVNLILQWHRCQDLLPPAADFLSDMFDAPLMEDIQPSLIFPNATHVKLINCRLLRVSDNYYVLSSQTSAEVLRGPHFWEDVFPQPIIALTIGHGCIIMEAMLGILTQTDIPASAEPVKYLSPTNTTHVTLDGLDFIQARNNWTIRPSVGITHSKTNTGPLSGTGSLNIEGGHFENIVRGVLVDIS